MQRQEAIEILVQQEINELSLEKRESILLDWWCIDVNSAEFSGIPNDLQVMLSKRDGPERVEDSIYDPLVRIGLRHSFKGVLNEYLETRMLKTGQDVLVEGVVETLYACPCCGYCSLDTQGGYEICKVCFWEDDGTKELDELSHANHMTLQHARDGFNSFGAISESVLVHVCPDGCTRYARDRLESL